MLASIEIISLTGIIASALAALFSAFTSRLARNAEDPKRITAWNSAPDDVSEEFQNELDTRLFDAREELTRQEKSAKWNGRSAASLAISQYVVGGTLATSFIQSALPEQAVGFLGLIVLLASIIYQRIRPDLRTSSARRRVAVLKSAIRKAEDGLFAIRQELADAPTLQEIRAEVTNTLNQIEHSEMDDNFLPLPESPGEDATKD